MKTTSILLCILFTLYANLCITPAKAQVNVNDSLALVDLYNSTNGPQWFDNTNWLTTTPVEFWNGVTVQFNRVTGLSLVGNNLAGTLPASIGDLTALVYLELPVNKLSGAIPSSIGNLTKLTDLNLGGNQLSGAIPATIGNLISANYIFLYENHLSGTIPAEIGNLVNLTYLNLTTNKLTGAIPSSIGNLKELFTLALDFNRLSGSIPPEIGKLKNMDDLGLSNNQLSGPIPSTIGNLKKMSLLVLNFNQLSGSIPYQLGKLTHLENLVLDNNQLSGPIPASLGKMSSLQYLSLNNNQLIGSIPVSFRKLANLQRFDLSHNQLSQYGNVYFQTPKRHVTGYINYNEFTFDGLEFVAKKYPNITYTPQANIPVHQHGSTLSVYAGGTLSNNTYKWQQVGETNVISLNGDSTFSPSQSGKYYVSVTNSVAKRLILHSDTIDFTMSSPVKQSSNILIAKTIQPATVIKHMQVFPNPAKEVVHVQINGKAMITITNSAGKVMLTKSINNSAEINVSAFAPGIYYLQNKASGEVQKIVVMH
jgi:Leucine-rich repeat (LRR) protein